MKKITVLLFTCCVFSSCIKQEEPGPKGYALRFEVKGNGIYQIRFNMGEGMVDYPNPPTKSMGSDFSATGGDTIFLGATMQSQTADTLKVTILESSPRKIIANKEVIAAPGETVSAETSIVLLVH